MSKVIINELTTELEQSFRLELNERYSIGAVIPYLYMHNAPAGTFRLTILSGVNVRAEKTFTSSDIKTELNTTSNYCLVFHPVVFDFPVQLDAGTYTARLSATGYTGTNTSFIAWCQQHEDLNNQLDYVPASDQANPLAMRLKTYRIY